MESSNKDNGHILLVEDEGSLLNALADFLRDQGYEVDAVEDPLKGLELFEHKVFDLVVTDYRLPNLSGLELLGRVKEMNPQIEVVIITGYGSKESVIEALRLGAYAFLEKPFDAIELLHIVANCLGTIRLQNRIDGLVEDLRDNQRKLERALASRDEELEDKQDRLERMTGIVRLLEEATASIERSANSIWDDARTCRRRGQGFLTDVARLVSTCATETRRITGSVSQLESVTHDIEGMGTPRSVDATYDQTEGERKSREPVSERRPLAEPEREVAGCTEPEDARPDVGPLYGEMQQVVLDVLRSVQNGEQIRIAPVREITTTLLQQEGALDALYGRAISSGGSGEWDLDSAVVTHSVNVSIFALKLSEGLNYGVSRMTDLGTAALVHDIGMASLPEDIYAKKVLDQADRAALRNHPVKGEAYLSHLVDQDAWLAEVALHEHEREDGSGYPNGLSGSQIREEAKIIGIVDTYAGLVQSRPDRRGLTPFDAVKEITQTHRKQFHPRILRALLQKLSAFPIGSLVRLNSGVVGRVSRTFEAYPLRPVLIPLYDGDKWPIEDPVPMSLRENPILHISGVVYPEDLQRFPS